MHEQKKQNLSLRACLQPAEGPETEATKAVKMLKLPPLLVVHLGRFAYDPQTGASSMLQYGVESRNVYDPQTGACRLPWRSGFQAQGPVCHPWRNRETLRSTCMP